MWFRGKEIVRGISRCKVNVTYRSFSSNLHGSRAPHSESSSGGNGIDPTKLISTAMISATALYITNQVCQTAKDIATKHEHTGIEERVLYEVITEILVPLLPEVKRDDLKARRFTKTQRKKSLPSNKEEKSQAKASTMKTDTVTSPPPTKTVDAGTETKKIVEVPEVDGTFNPVTLVSAAGILTMSGLIFSLFQ